MQPTTSTRKPCGSPTRIATIGRPPSEWPSNDDDASALPGTTTITTARRQITLRLIDPIYVRATATRPRGSRRPTRQHATPFELPTDIGRGHGANGCA